MARVGKGAWHTLSSAVVLAGGDCAVHSSGIPESVFLPAGRVNQVRVETKLSALDNGNVKGNTNTVMVMAGQFQVGMQTSRVLFCPTQDLIKGAN